MPIKVKPTSYTPKPSNCESIGELEQEKASRQWKQQNGIDPGPLKPPPDCYGQ